jgi:serine/threonine protein kinase
MSDTSDTDRSDDILPVGYWLGNFRIDGVLGRGGFGVTYRAWADDLQEPVAIKEYYPSDIALRRPGEHTISARTPRDTDSFEWGRQRFIDEARTLAALRQANPRNYSIVRVRMLFEEHGTAYMVQDFIEGYPLSEYLEDHRTVPEELLKRWLGGILDGLAVVHGQDMIHRDLTPSNILIEDDDTPVLIDFGSARNLVESHTRLHDRVYKQSYAPIEQSSTDSARQGPWTDIYSLAVVLYESVTGGLPPEAPDRVEEDACTPAAQAARGTYTPAFLAAIDHGLAVFSRDRPKSIEEWRTELFSEAPVVPREPEHVEEPEFAPEQDPAPGPWGAPGDGTPEPAETDTAPPDPGPVPASDPEPEPVPEPEPEPAPEPAPEQKPEAEPEPEPKPAPASTTRRKRRVVVAALAVVALIVVGAVGYLSPDDALDIAPSEPGIYLTRDVRAGDMATADRLKVVGGQQAVPGTRPASMSEIDGTCFAQVVSAGTLVLWVHLSVDCR